MISEMQENCKRQIHLQYDRLAFLGSFPEYQIFLTRGLVSGNVSLLKSHMTRQVQMSNLIQRSINKMFKLKQTKKWYQMVRCITYEQRHSHVKHQICLISSLEPILAILKIIYTHIHIHTHSSLVNIACVRHFNPLKAECFQCIERLLYYT